MQPACAVMGRDDRRDTARVSRRARRKEPCLDLAIGPVLGTQWGQGPVPSTGPRRLAVALLEDAVRCLRTRPRPSDGPLGARRAQELRAETEAWFAAADDTPGGFGWVCAALGLEPDAVRRKLPMARRRYIRAYLDGVR